MFGLGVGELLVIFLFVLIFIGPKKLPELAKSLGKGLREFQNATKGFTEQLDQAKREITEHVDLKTLNLNEEHAKQHPPMALPMQPNISDAPSELTSEESKVVVVQQDDKDKDSV